MKIKTAMHMSRRGWTWCVTLCTRFVFSFTFILIISLNPLCVWVMQTLTAPWSSIPLEHDLTWRMVRAVDSLSYTLFGTTVNSEFFTQNELFHLQDVGKIIWVLFGFCIFVWALALLWKKRLFTKASNSWKVSEAIVTIIIVSLCSGATAFFFPQLFQMFHQVLFPHGNYTFSASSTLIQTFPPGFWLGEFLCFEVLIIAMMQRQSAYQQ